MAKKHNSGISKKGFPGLIRIKDENGNKVWRYNGTNHNSLRELDIVMNPAKYMNMKFIPKVEDDVVEPSEKDISDIDHSYINKES